MDWRQRAKVDELRRAAEEQILAYSMDEKLGKVPAKATLVKLVLIFSGHELIYIGEGKSRFSHPPRGAKRM
ncbi:MAG: hypothetical protein GY950_34295 [bacterium]|nr:hypothetical protein [bacterium]